MTTLPTHDHRYWKATPHIFRAANWGPEFCALCTFRETGEGVDHLDPASLTPNDPRAHRQGIVTSHFEETWYKVYGWNETDGASCSYSGCDSFNAAVEVARLYQAHGDHNGRVYENYHILVMHHYSVVDTDAHPLPEGATP